MYPKQGRWFAEIKEDGLISLQPHSSSHTQVLHSVTDSTLCCLMTSYRASLCCQDESPRQLPSHHTSLTIFATHSTRCVQDLLSSFCLSTASTDFYISPFLPVLMSLLSSQCHSRPFISVPHPLCFLPPFSLHSSPHMKISWEIFFPPFFSVI